MKFFIGSLIVIVGLFALLATSKPTPSTNAASQQERSMQTIQADVHDGAKFYDVRTPEEFTAGHIDGAINFPLQTMQAGSLPEADKSKPIYVYCRSGNRSAEATTILKAAGYQNVINLGGMTDVTKIGGVVKS